MADPNLDPIVEALADMSEAVDALVAELSATDPRAAQIVSQLEGMTSKLQSATDALKTGPAGATGATGSTSGTTSVSTGATGSTGSVGSTGSAGSTSGATSIAGVTSQS